MNHYRISEIKTRIDEPLDCLPEKLAKRLEIKPESIVKWEIRRQSIDSRHKPDLKYVYTVDFWCDKNLDRSIKKLGKNLQFVDEEAERTVEPAMGSEKINGRLVVVGMGPCGIFAALTLAKRGYKPLVLERGPEMSERAEAVEKFRKNGVLNPEANMLYGEGGAGTFSDGKLATGIKDGNIRNVLKEFRDAGAGEDIMYLAKPHIGTDVLKTTIVNLRKKIVELGGEVRFNTRVESFNIEDGQLNGITVVSEGKSEIIETNVLILAIGHSARDTFKVINEAGLNMEQKPFSIGVRMEHPQELIDRAQYGEEALSKYREFLPPADYRINTKASNGRGVYSFCMCPGGEVVVCTTREGELAVNGMSNRKRDSGTANSGILCDVRVEDYNNGNLDDVLAGVRYQEKYERLAYENGGKNYNPPTARMVDFLSNNAKQIDNSLPDYASEAIREAVRDFGRKIKGYDNDDAIIKAVETRSSSPVRIVRGENGVSNIGGIYPAGEGAGYAGGITSAACDGIRAANHIIEKYSKK